MDSHSRSNKGPPKGLPPQSGEKKELARKIIYSNTYFISGAWVTRRKKNRQTGAYLIGRAYQEPRGEDLIEEIVLGRDFIID